MFWNLSWWKKALLITVSGIPSFFVWSAIGFIAYYLFRFDVALGIPRFALIYVLGTLSIFVLKFVWKKTSFLKDFK